jgi:hypothetical protein
LTVPAAELAHDPGCAVFTESDRESLVQMPVLGLELAISFGRDLESAP